MDYWERSTCVLYIIVPAEFGRSIHVSTSKSPNLSNPPHPTGADIDGERSATEVIRPVLPPTGFRGILTLDVNVSAENVRRANVEGDRILRADHLWWRDDPVVQGHGRDQGWHPGQPRHSDQYGSHAKVVHLERWTRLGYLVRWFWGYIERGRRFCYCRKR